MFKTLKLRHRGTREATVADGRLAEAGLKASPHGLFLLDAKAKVLPPVSPSLGVLLRRREFSNLTFEKLLAPLVSAKTLTALRNHLSGLLSGAEDLNLSHTLDVRLANADGSHDSAQYSFDFIPVSVLDEPRLWLVRVADVTETCQMARDLQDLRGQVQMQSQMLGSVLTVGAARFAEFIQKTDASMKVIAAALKKPAREDDAFRLKLEEILNEADRIRREAAAFRISAVEHAARTFEDSLQELKSRRGLSGSDFLPLAVKLDTLFDRFAQLKSLIAAAAPAQMQQATVDGAPTTHNGTAIMEAPAFDQNPAQTRARPTTQRPAPAGSLDGTLQSLTLHVAQECDKQVLLESSGLELIPQKYLAVIKNVTIQLIRNSVMHGIEPPDARAAAGKQARGTLRIDFRLKDGAFELMFEDDGCGLTPDRVREVAVARGVVTAEAAARLRDREAIKLIFKSRYTTLAGASRGAAHGTGMSLVRRYVHEAGGKIALASLPGHETRFKVTLPALQDAAADDSPPADVQAA